MLDKFTKPKARIELGQALATLATSCMDISDGILLDCSRLAKASKVGLQINLEELSLHPALKNLSFEDALKYASAGDDYELIFTVPPKFEEKISLLDKKLSIGLKIVGRVVAETGLKVLYNNLPYTAEIKGYQHFN